MKKILVVDNQDSFVYNLIELLRILSVDFDVVSSDRLDVSVTDRYRGVLLSPGAGVPSDYEQMELLIKEWYERLPMLGVCLGHQALATFFTAKLTRLANPLHGHAGRLIIEDGKDNLFNGVPNLSVVGQYHSWVVDPPTLPDYLRVIARDEQGNIMAFKHSQLPLYGVQFHPESIITDRCGGMIIENWCNSV